MAIALSRAGFSIDNLVYRSREPSRALLEKIEGGTSPVRLDELAELRSGVVLLTVADSELDAAVESIVSKIDGTAVLLHTSGALSSEVLKPAAKRGIATGSVHPLVSISDPISGAEYFRGAFFCVEGTAVAAAAAERLVHALGGKSFSIAAEYKPLYHAAAVLTSGHLTSLFSTAVRTLSACGLDASRAKEILLPLAESSISNLSRQPTAAALTGPFARTDPDAVERHLSAFDASGLEDEARIYLELGLESLRLAEENGGDGEKIDRMRNIIKLAQGPGK